MKKIFNPVVLILLFVIFAITPIATTLAEEETGFTLSNGMKVVLKPHTSSPLVAINFCLRVGPILENQETSGYSSVLSAMLFNTTDKNEKISLSGRIERLGIKRGVQLTNDFTGYTFVGTAAKLEEMLKLALEGVYKHRFLETHLNQTKEEQLNKVYDRLTKPEYRAANALLESIFTRHPYRNPILGLETSIQKMNLKSLEAFYKSYYLPSNTYLVVVGNFNEGGILNKIEELSKGLSKEKVNLPKIPWEPNQQRARQVSLTDYQDYAFVHLGWPVPGSESFDKYVFHVISQLVGGSKTSLLWRHTVDKKLAVFAGSSYYDSFHPFVFQIAGVTTPGKVEPFIEEVKNIVKMLGGGEIGEAELEEVKNKLISNDYFLREDLEFQALNYGMYAIFNRLSEADSFGENIRKVTIDDIRRVSLGFLDATRLSVARLTPTPPSPDASPELITLKNNLRLILKENHDSPVISVSIRVGAGSIKDTERQLGLANLVALMLEHKKGADGLTVREKLDRLGVRYEIEPRREYIAIDLECLTSTFLSGLELVLDMLRQPAFTQSSLDETRDLILKEIPRQDEDILDFARGFLMTKLFPKSIYGQKIQGNVQTLPAISLNNAVNFHKKYYVGQNIVVAVVGDFYGLDVKDWLLERFSGFSGSIVNEPAQQSVALPSKAESHRINFNKRQALSIYGARSISTLDARAPALDILKDILCKSPDSRLRRRFADNPHILEVNCESKSVGNEGYFYVYGVCEPNYIASLTQSIREEIEKLCADGFSEQEFVTAKQRVLDEFSFKMGRNKQKSAMFATDEIVGKGFNYYIKMPILLEAVNRGQVTELMTGHVFTNTNSVETIIAP
jgi:zinc protease